LPILSSLASEPVRPKSRRIKTISTPRRIQHFTMSHEKWRSFYNHRTCEVAIDWTTQLIPYLVQVGITCPVVFRKHYIRKKYSRKKNCNIFTAKGHCKLNICPIDFVIMVEDEPKNKENPCIFTVIIFHNVNHDSTKETASRHLTGSARVAMGMSFLFLNHSVEI
jgi:hypothetical protein